MWLLYAVGSAFFASLTAILGKIGISGVESNLGTAIRTCVVLLSGFVGSCNRSILDVLFQSTADGRYQ